MLDYFISHLFCLIQIILLVALFHFRINLDYYRIIIDIVIDSWGYYFIFLIFFEFFDISSIDHRLDKSSHVHDAIGFLNIFINIFNQNFDILLFEIHLNKLNRRVNVFIHE